MESVKIVHEERNSIEFLCRSAKCNAFESDGDIDVNARTARCASEGQRRSQRSFDVIAISGSLSVMARENIFDYIKDAHVLAIFEIRNTNERSMEGSNQLFRIGAATETSYRLYSTELWNGENKTFPNLSRCCHYISSSVSYFPVTLIAHTAPATIFHNSRGNNETSSTLFCSLRCHFHGIEQFEEWESNRRK